MRSLVLATAYGFVAASSALASAQTNPLSDYPCRLCADLNGDGEVSPSDFNAWIATYNSGNLAADQNDDGVVSPADFNAFILNFNDGPEGPFCNSLSGSGCPSTFSIVTSSPLVTTSQGIQTTIQSSSDGISLNSVPITVIDAQDLGGAGLYRYEVNYPVPAGNPWGLTPGDTIRVNLFHKTGRITYVEGSATRYAVVDFHGAEISLASTGYTPEPDLIYFYQIGPVFGDAVRADQFAVAQVNSLASAPTLPFGDQELDDPIVVDGTTGFTVFPPFFRQVNCGSTFPGENYAACANRAECRAQQRDEQCARNFQNEFPATFKDSLGVVGGGCAVAGAICTFTLTPAAGAVCCLLGGAAALDIARGIALLNRSNCFGNSLDEYSSDLDGCNTQFPL